jgi:hypothetical protein
MPKTFGIFDCDEMSGLNAQTCQFTQGDQHRCAGWVGKQRFVRQEAIAKRSDEDAIQGPVRQSLGVSCDIRQHCPVAVIRPCLSISSQVTDSPVLLDEARQLTGEAAHDVT